MRYWSFFVVFLVGCTTANHVQLAESYKLDLQYYQYAVRFAKRNMVDEAEESCSRTKVLRSECYTSLVQHVKANNGNLPQRYCDEIVPDLRMNMTKKAFKLVYGEISEELEDEIKEKLKPSEQRINVVTKIKGLCS